LRDSRRKFEIHRERKRERERGKTCDEKKLQWRRGEASVAMRGSRAQRGATEKESFVLKSETSEIYFVIVIENKRK
jgi:hypothetical protein